jgi:hypothetical protein
MTQGPTDSSTAAPSFRVTSTRLTNRLSLQVPAWRRFRTRQELQLAGALWHADPALAAGWWSLLALRGLLPAAFAIASGFLVAAVEHHQALAVPLAVVGMVFILLQVLGPLHTALSANLGDRTAAWLYDELTGACLGPPGIGHLEDPELAADLQVARDFDRGMTAPPLSVSMDFIASGLVDMVAGLAQAVVLFGFAFWAPPVLAVAWLSTHWLLRESAVWKDRNTDEVRQAQRDAEYAYRLAVDPPAAKELRIFGLPDWVLDRFVTSRRRLHQLQYQATRMRERSVLGAMLIVLAANVGVFWLIGAAALGHRIGLGPLVVYAQAAVGTSMIASAGSTGPSMAPPRRSPRSAGSRPQRPLLERSRRARCPRPGCKRHRSASGTSASPTRRHRTGRCCPALTWTSRPAARWQSSGSMAPGKPRWPSCYAGSTTRSPARSKSTAPT